MADQKPEGSRVNVPELAQPQRLLEVLVHDLEVEPALSGFCAGFESGKWRVQQFAGHLMEWLPEFALTHSELEQLDHSNAVRFMRRAANLIFFRITLKITFCKEKSMFF